MKHDQEFCSIQGSARCDGCGAPIDPSVCWCGATCEDHGPFENHGFVPLGCECHRDRPHEGVWFGLFVLQHSARWPGWASQDR